IYAFMNLNPMWGLGTGIQKMLFKNRASLKLAVSDIFRKNLPSAFINYRDYQETFVVYRETRQASLTYTQRFGDKQLAPSRRRVGGAEDEKQRAGAGSQG
ncbi:MAG: outer membrane beta-barrel protein, partial [Saprospiraceae bacterium]